MLIPLTTEQQQWVDTTLNAMTLPQCVGQLLCAFSPRFTTTDWLDLLEMEQAEEDRDELATWDPDLESAFALV